MKNWFKQHKMLIFVFLIFIFLGIFYFAMQKFAKVPINSEINNSEEKINGNINEKIPYALNDPFLKHHKLLDFAKQELRTSEVILGDEKKSNNGMPDTWNGFNTRVSNLNLGRTSDSEYYTEEQNPKKIDGIYYVRSVEGVPTLYKMATNAEIAYEVDIKIPPNSAKHKMISEKHFAYIAEVDVDQTGKSVVVLNLETNQEHLINASKPEMRIASIFASPDAKKIVVGEEYPPTSGDNFATGDTLNHRVWVYDLENPELEPAFIFDQQLDVIERWPIFWSQLDNKVYFNSCDVKELHCNFGITRTSPISDDREPVPGLEVGTYASQPVLSNNGRHIAYVAWNGNKETPLYKEGDNKNNEFLNKNSIWLYDIENGEKKELIDFGNNRIIDHLFWSPDGMFIYFELRQLVKNVDGSVFPTSNSTGFWRVNVATAKFERIAQDVTISPGQILSHFNPVPNGSGIMFTITKIFPKTTFNDPTKEVEKVEYLLRLSDMKLIELGDNVMSVFKTEPL